MPIAAHRAHVPEARVRAASGCRVRRGGRRRALGEVGFIDFDDCGHGLLAYDLAALLDSLLRRMSAPGTYPALRAALLEGYGRVRALPGDLDPALRATKAMRDMVNVNFIVSSTNPNVRAWGAERLGALLTHLPGYVEGEAWIGI